MSSTTEPVRRGAPDPAGGAGRIPLSRLERAAAVLRRPTGLLLAALCALWLVAVVRAPVDSMQGVIQKILYVHVPLVFSAYLGFFLTALGGFLYLWKSDEVYDRLARSAAEVGVLFCTLVIVTGPIWARGTWGQWWSWDTRLTVTLVLWLIYLSYLLLRSFTEGSARTARFASAYGIVGILAVPLNYLAIDLAGGRSIHPENLERGSLGAGMGWPFLAGVLTSFVAFFFLLWTRLEIEALRNEAARRAAGEDELDRAEEPGCA